jgi:serine/threonine-protein kinase
MSVLTPESWPVISALLDEALALPAGERDTWLQSLDGERAALKGTLRELLSRADGVETNDFLATLPRLTRVASPAAGPLTELAAGDAIGPYRLLSELGAGGMGAVWLAERSDGQLKRKVALKLPRMVWAKGLAERMARERDILATLEHPNIARLYDAGVDQHGRPYLALEYVEGQPIDVYARERGLSVRQKLDLLLQVCGAVAFAHSRLVVHRDLKPGNILVTSDGQVRLLDFGIAKLMEGDSAQETQLTQLAGRALTLDYASPEQIRGEPIGTASDVYSLGVVAYVLLTEAKPYRLKRGSAAELEEAIASADPPKASEAATDASAKKALHGDLDAILSKALKKLPGQRYATADALAEDMRSHLGGHRVAARPDSFVVRTARFGRRHPAGLAIASGIALAAVGGLHAQAAVSLAFGAGALVALWQRREALRAAVRADTQRRRALAALRRSGSVVGLFQDILDQAGDGKPFTAAELLERSVALANGAGVDPVARSASLIALATIYSMRGMAGKAEALMQVAVEAARASGDRSLVAEATAHLGSMVARGSSPTEGKRILERVLVDHADDADALVLAHRALSFLAQNGNEATAAVWHAERALAALDSAAYDSPLSRSALVGNLAYSLSLAGRLNEAMDLFARAMKMFEALGRSESSIALTVLNNWGLAALSGGDLLQALRHFDQVIEVGERLADGTPPLYALGNRARVRAALSQFELALEDAERLIGLARSSGSIAIELHAEGTRIQALRSIGRADEARAALAAARTRFDGNVPPKGPGMLNLRRQEALLAQDEGRHADAAALLDELVQAMESTGLRTGALASLVAAQAESRLHVGRADEARSIALKALEIARNAQGGLRHSAEVGNALLQLAGIAQATGDAAGMQRAAAEAVEHLAPTLGGAHLLTRKAVALLDGLGHADSGEPAAPAPAPSLPSARAVN